MILWKLPLLPGCLMLAPEPSPEGNRYGRPEASQCWDGSCQGINGWASRHVLLVSLGPTTVPGEWQVAGVT